MKPFYKTSSNMLWVAALIVIGVFVVFIFTGNGYEKFEKFLLNSFPSDEVFLGKVLSVHEEAANVNDNSRWIQTITIKFLTGTIRGQETDVHVQGATNADPGQKVQAGETIVIAKNHDYQGDAYYVIDRYRLPALFFIFLLFVGAVIAFGRMRGLASLLGLATSIAVLLGFVVPRILHGGDPLFISFIGAIVIAVFSLYLAHGFSKRTTVALVGTLVTLAIAVAMTLIFISMTNLLGLATEESFYLKLNIGIISLRGLLLAGIIIGMLGILDDVTVGQTMTVYELKEANPNFGFMELYRRATKIGREHIASLVNTLFLVYAGASFPLFLLLAAQSDKFPLWLSVNGELIAEEIVRTLVGSLALIFAVPITTLLAAYCYGKRRQK